MRFLCLAVLGLLASSIHAEPPRPPAVDAWLRMNNSADERRRNELIDQHVDERYQSLSMDGLRAKRRTDCRWSGRYSGERKRSDRAGVDTERQRVIDATAGASIAGQSSTTGFLTHLFCSQFIRTIGY